MNIKLKPELKNLYKLNDFILKSTSKKNLHIDLMVEEIFVNIVNYSGADYICVNTNYTDNILSVEFIDNGFEFNPLLKESVNIPSNIEEAQIGGLGIHLTKQLADTIDYSRINGENHLKITKKVE